MKKTNFVMIIVIVVLLVGALAIAAPAFAAGSCTFNSQHGWHIVGGGSSNEHWYATEAECLAALVTPTDTVVPTETVLPTETAIPTDTATEAPTEPPVDTETPSPTDIPAETPVVTPSPTSTPEIVVIIQKIIRNGSCNRFWRMIRDNKFKDVGYRYFENHPWCKSWLLNKKGIDFDVYKALHP